jgi:iron complex transport system ATP-binding protein
MLQLDQLVVGYPGTRGTVLDGISIKAPPSSFVCLLGRNGAGKSTLMRSIAGLQPALGGSATLDDENLLALSPAQRARRIALVLTERIASPGLTVDDVVLLGRAPFSAWHGRLSAADYAIARDALTQTGAHPFAGRLFDSLSDGERQRVMIARAIAQTPRLMILDEITAFLDLPGRVEMMTMLREHARQSGCITLLSSHDLDLSLQLADEIWLAGGDGRLAIGTPGALAQSGEINMAFDSGAVRFSAKLGRFELRSQGLS